MVNSLYASIYSHSKMLSLCLFIAMLGTAFMLHSSLWYSDTTNEDIFYLYQDGKRIASGENPYARIHEGNMQENRKYSTYLPLFYLLSAATQKIGLNTFESWLSFWRAVFFLFATGTGILIFYFFLLHDLPLAGCLFSGFWLFNRWALHLSKIAQIDGMTLFFFIFALILFEKKTGMSFFFLGISLAIKQMAVFALPLFFFALPYYRRKDLIRNTGFLLLIPLFSSLPFMLWDISGFVKSILFSATRTPADHFGVPSADSIAGLVGIPAKIPLLAGLFIVYILTFQKRLSLFSGVFLTFILFIDFNSVLFRQYLIWPTATLPLAAFCWFESKKSLKEKTAISP